eukprot:TRINITY_DN18917_c0_g1_i1.p1 TRINITY_DN18917_c0_g1~~TRINITY_DN18917_c0_g1_i1.p1  ORF type:complete len:409 (+),score=11.62 TRINITY_DN18917_c0_g1_i1:25-1251(+)
MASFPPQEEDHPEGRACSSCQRLLPSSSFTQSQLTKHGARARCRDCISVTERDRMGWSTYHRCAECQQWFTPDQFSRSQQKRGQGARCLRCTTAFPPEHLSSSPRLTPISIALPIPHPPDRQPPSLPGQGPSNTRNASISRVHSALPQSQLAQPMQPESRQQGHQGTAACQICHKEFNAASLLTATAGNSPTRCARFPGSFSLALACPECVLTTSHGQEPVLAAYNESPPGGSYHPVVHAYSPVTSRAGEPVWPDMADLSLTLPVGASTVTTSDPSLFLPQRRCVSAPGSTRRSSHVLPAFSYAPTPLTSLHPLSWSQAGSFQDPTRTFLDSTLFSTAEGVAVPPFPRTASIPEPILAPTTTAAIHPALAAVPPPLGPRIPECGILPVQVPASDFAKAWQRLITRQEQ